MAISDKEVINRRRLAKLYKDPDKYFMIHEDDPDLDPVRIWLPKPPDPLTIDGYGLAPHEQKFKPNTIPPRLLELDTIVKTRLQAEFSSNRRKIVTGQRILEETLKFLNEKRKDYQEEIEWVFKEISYLNDGYWFYCNGKPTYLDPWHYFYINYWKLDIGLPQYRDRDRRWFLFARYCYTTQEDELGNNLGFRTCYGFTYPKHRRDGATYKCLAIGYHMSMWRKNGLFGIQSFNDDNAGDHYMKKLVPAWQKLPFFLKPMWTGSNAPADELNFSLPSNKVIGEQLGSRINYATTASRSFYDGKKQICHLSDENGKTEREDVGQRHLVVRETLSQGRGAIIHGFSMHPTTVADMEAGGGMQFYHLCNQSKFYERNPLTGQTKTGLFRLFIPAYDGLEGFIGPYGESIIDDPTPEQAKFIRKNYGARKHLESEREELRLAGDADSIAKLKSVIQLYPTCYDDCFRMTGGDVGFDTEILDRRISDLKRLKPNESPVVKGDFYWSIDGELVSASEFIDRGLKGLNGNVVFMPSEKGNFELSKILPFDKTNKKFSRMERDGENNPMQVYYPEDVNGMIASADPFQFLDPSLIKIKGTKDTMSDGGGAVFWKRDTKFDPDDKPIDLWESHRFVCTYLNRPSLDDYYAEEMLMMCIYFNAYMFPERNVKLIIKHFAKRGCNGYLVHKVDTVKNTVDPVAGFHSLKELKDDLFKATRNHIRKHGARERHLTLLRQWREIKNIKQMTSYDLLTAAGGCLLTLDNPYTDRIDQLNNKTKQSININDIAQVYSY